MFTVIESLFSCFSLSRVIFWVSHNFLVWEIHFLVPDPWIEMCHVLLFPVRITSFRFWDSIFRFQIPVHVFFRLNKEFSSFGITFLGFKSLFMCFSSWTKNFLVLGFHFPVSNPYLWVFPIQQRFFRFWDFIFRFWVEGWCGGLGALDNNPTPCALNSTPLYIFI